MKNKLASQVLKVLTQLLAQIPNYYLPNKYIKK